VSINGTIGSLSTTFGAAGFASSAYSGNAVYMTGSGLLHVLTSTNAGIISGQTYAVANDLTVQDSAPTSSRVQLNLTTTGNLSISGTVTGNFLSLTTSAASPGLTIFKNGNQPTILANGSFVTPAELIAAIQATSTGYRFPTNQTLQIATTGNAYNPGTGSSYSIASINLPAGGFSTLNNPSGVTLNQLVPFSSSTVVNAGTIQGQVNITSSGAFTNSGTVSPTSGTTSSINAGSIANTGVISSTVGSALNLTAATALTNSGQISVTGPALAVNGPSITNTGTISGGAQTLTFNSATGLSINSAGQWNGQITAPTVAFVAAGGINVYSNSFGSGSAVQVTGTGATVQAATGNLLVTSVNVASLGTVDFEAPQGALTTSVIVVPGGSVTLNAQTIQGTGIDGSSASVNVSSATGDGGQIQIYTQSPTQQLVVGSSYTNSNYLPGIG
jgi:hypothetical protein